MEGFVIAKSHFTISSYLQFCNCAKNSLDKFKTVRVVLGNPTCDLDSAVSTLVYGMLCQEEVRMAEKDEVIVLPVYNIMHFELCMRKDVIYWMKDNAIPLDLLIFKAHVDMKSLHKSKKLELILVDHHVLRPFDYFLDKSVVEIIDHRLPETGWAWSGKQIFKRTGSCCTLMTFQLVSRRRSMLSYEVCRLLYGPILFDTACLSENTGLTTELDKQAIYLLEERLGKFVNRDTTFQRLLDAHSNISALSSIQMLGRDLRTVRGIPVCTLPILIEKFIEASDVHSALEEVCESMGVPTLIILGTNLKKHSVTRDLAIFSIGDPSIGQKLAEFFEESVKPQLQLKLVSDLPNKVNIPGLILFRQGNVRISREDIVPLVKAAKSVLNT